MHFRLLFVAFALPWCAIGCGRGEQKPDVPVSQTPKTVVVAPAVGMKKGIPAALDPVDTQPIRYVTFSATGQFLASISYSGTVRLHDLKDQWTRVLEDGDVPLTFAPRGQEIPLAIAPTSRYVAWRSASGGIRTFHIAVRKPGPTLEELSPVDRDLRIAFSLREEVIVTPFNNRSGPSGIAWFGLPSGQLKTQAEGGEISSSGLFTIAKTPKAWGI